MTEYRDYEIIPDPNWHYIFTHKEYTGPEDFCGHGKTIRDCMDQIDDMLEEDQKKMKLIFSC